MSDVDSLPVRHLFTFRCGLASPSLVGGPAGTRVVVGVQDGVITGARVNGVTTAGIGGDFAVMRADGSVALDVRLVIHTDDGVNIYMTYNGVGVSDGSGGLTIKTAPTFETGDDRYAWLNNVQAVGLGATDMTTLTYEVYELVP